MVGLRREIVASFTICITVAIVLLQVDELVARVFLLYLFTDWNTGAIFVKGEEKAVR